MWRIWPLVWQARRRRHHRGRQGRLRRPSPASRRSRVADRLAQDGSVYVDTKPDCDQTYQLFNNGKIGMVITGPWQLPDFIDAKVDFGVAPLPTLRRRAADDLGAGHVDAVRQRRQALEGRRSSSSSGSTRPSRTRSGSRRRARCRCARAPPSSRRGRTYQEEIPGLSVFLAGLDGAAHEADQPAPTRRSPRRWGSRSSPCCSKRSSPQDALQQAVAGERGSPRRRRLSGGWPSPSSARPPRAQRVFGETPTAWLWVTPAVVIILGLSLAADGAGRCC